MSDRGEGSWLTKHYNGAFYTPQSLFTAYIKLAEYVD